MQQETQIILPVIALVVWSLVMWVWMYVTRLPAMKKAKIKPDPHAVNGEQLATLPAEVRWKADNYTHLMEQPTIFYALVFSVHLIGEGHGLNLWLAWGYVLLRVIHSFVQTLGNIIELRFCVFLLSTLCLFGLTINAALALLAYISSPA